MTTERDDTMGSLFKFYSHYRVEHDLPQDTAAILASAALIAIRLDDIFDMLDNIDTRLLGMPGGEE